MNVSIPAGKSPTIVNPYSGGVGAAAEPSSPDRVLTGLSPQPLGLMPSPKSATSTMSRVICAGLAGTMALMVCGCKPSDAPAPTSTSQTATPQTQAAVNKIFDDVSHASSPAELSKGLTTAIQQYAAKSGQNVSDITAAVVSAARTHPVVSISVLLASGVVTGVALEKLGVPKGLSDIAAGAINGIGQSGSGTAGANAVADWVNQKQNAFVAGIIGGAAAATVGYLVYTALAPQPQTPQTEPQKKLYGAMDALETQANAQTNGNALEQAQDIQKHLTQSVQEYVKSSGKSAKDAANDVASYLLAHPGVSVAVILAAGTTTGVILEKAGVPSSVAGVAGTALDAAKSNATMGLGAITHTIKQYPLASAAIGTALATGAGYVMVGNMAPAATEAAKP